MFFKTLHFHLVCRVKENEEVWRSSIEAAVTNKEEKAKRVQTEKQLVVDQVIGMVWGDGDDGGDDSGCDDLG